MRQSKENLKIEFRAVPYSFSHVLEYRFSPNQDLWYHEEHEWLCGLIKFSLPKKYSTKWSRVTIFFNGVTTKFYPEDEAESRFGDFSYIIHSREDLQEFKDKFKTFGEFMKWYSAENKRKREEYINDRKQYLKEQGIWE